VSLRIEHFREQSIAHPDQRSRGKRSGAPDSLSKRGGASTRAVSQPTSVLVASRTRRRIFGPNRSLQNARPQPAKQDLTGTVTISPTIAPLKAAVRHGECECLVRFGRCSATIQDLPFDAGQVGDWERTGGEAGDSRSLSHQVCHRHLGWLLGARCASSPTRASSLANTM
jgi:hypothetical protein